MHPLVPRLEQICKLVINELVDHLDCVQVESTSGAATIIISATVHGSDVGKVVGKHGRTVNNLRGLLETISAKNKVKVLIEVDGCE